MYIFEYIYTHAHTHTYIYIYIQWIVNIHSGNDWHSAMNVGITMPSTTHDCNLTGNGEY